MNQSQPFSMPAEWERQAATWLSWPHNVETWPGNLADAQREFIELVKNIADHQQVMVLSGGVAWEAARSALKDFDHVRLIDIPTNDAWARDYAPTFVRNANSGELSAIDWRYNAWGGKYPPFDRDQQVASLVARELEIDTISPDFCFEGGAIEINQAGLLLTTESCALNPNRNLGANRENVESIFQNCLGAKRVVWLTGDAIDGDDTDGHIDQLARFTNDRTIVYAWCDEQEDRRRAPLATNLADLQRGLELESTQFELIPLPIPPTLDYCDRRIPASYCNFLITNRKVIVPQFGVASYDQQALEILRALFHDRETIGLNSINLSVGLGSFHCLSQQQPK